MKTILTFGHLPQFAGGKQSSGLANVIWELANNINKLDQQDYRVILAATDIHNPQGLVDETEVIGWTKKSLIKYIIANPAIFMIYMFRTTKLKFNYGFPLINTLAKLIFYHKSIHEVNPEFIHVHGCHAIIFFCILNIKDYNIFITLHGINGQDKNIPDNKNLSLMEQDLNKLPFIFGVFITHDLVNQWRNYYGKPDWSTEVILNAYNLDRFYLSKNVKRGSPVRDKKYRIATIASVTKLKGQRRVLEALSSLNNLSIFEYFCAGTGESNQIKYLEKFAKSTNISFQYLGYCQPSEIRKLLYNIDFMILPSSSEGFGLAFLESIACGTPVILPANLPIAKEKNLLNHRNSILLEDESSESIAKVLKNIKQFHFDRRYVAESISHLNWRNIACEYLKRLDDIQKIK